MDVELAPLVDELDGFAFGGDHLGSLIELAGLISLTG